jgi:RING-like zinc finger
MEDANSTQRSGSQRSLGSRISGSCSKKVAAWSGDDVKAESGAISTEAQTSIDSNGGKENRSDSLADEEVEQAVLAYDFNDCQQKVYIPLPGQTTLNAEATEDSVRTRRMVNSGCAICLCRFDPEEKITWSATPTCPHVFHNDCILHWFLAVGRKAENRCVENHPDMTDDDILRAICDFPTNCPSCRQSFCRETEKIELSASSTETENNSDEEPQHGEDHTTDIETGSISDR